MDWKAELDRLKASYDLLGPDAPDLVALLGAAVIVTSQQQSETIEAPRWVLVELQKHLGRWMADAGMLKKAPSGNAKPKRPRGRPRREERRPLQQAKDLAKDLERWKAVTWERLRGLSREKAILEISEQTGSGASTIRDSYDLIEALRSNQSPRITKQKRKK